MNSKSILITRKLSQTSALKAWAVANNFTLIEQSFISFEIIPKVVIPQCDWIFFSSPNGVKIYLENHKIQANKIAALSTGTANELLANNIVVDFTGDSNSATGAIGAEFLKELKPSEKVLFPLSNISRKNVSNQLAYEQKIEIEIYKTLLVGKKINQDLAAIIFTSPSNVQGFFQTNKIDDSTQVIAIGETTKVEIEKLTNHAVAIADSYDEVSIISLLD